VVMIGWGDITTTHVIPALAARISILSILRLDSRPPFPHKHRRLQKSTGISFAGYHTFALHSQSSTKMTDQANEHIASKYRYELLFGAWMLVTGATFLKISKQPYSSRLKTEQYESIFKGTSLGAILFGIGMTPTRSGARRFRTN
jgi:hypothetical protein